MSETTAKPVKFTAQLKLVDKVSKDGKPYSVIFLQLTEKTHKMIFLDPAEVELVRLTHG